MPVVGTSDGQVYESELHQMFDVPMEDAQTSPETQTSEAPLKITVTKQKYEDLPLSQLVEDHRDNPDVISSIRLLMDVMDREYRPYSSQSKIQDSQRRGTPLAAAAGISDIPVLGNTINKNSDLYPNEQKYGQQLRDWVNYKTDTIEEKPVIGIGDIVNSAGKDLMKFGSHIVDALTIGPKLMEKVYNGEINPDSEEGIKHVNDLAMTFGTAGLMTAPLRPGVGMFGGRFSKAAEQAATKMEKEGFSDISIKEMTGLERGVEGNWHREFSDSNATVNPSKLNTVFKDFEGRYVKAGFLDDILKHDELFRAYPELRTLPVLQMKSLSHLLPGGPSEVYHGMYTGGESPSIHIMKGLRKEELRDTLLHEVQHAIQDIEGRLVNQDSKVKEYADAILKSWGKEDLLKVHQLLKEGKKEEGIKLFQKIEKDAAYAAYRARSEEVEAFNVGRRKDMTPQEIRQSLGRETEDVQRKLQILPE